MLMQQQQLFDDLEPKKSWVHVYWKYANGDVSQIKGAFMGFEKRAGAFYVMIVKEDNKTFHYIPTLQIVKLGVRM